MSVLQALATVDNGNGLVNALYHRNRTARGFLPFLSSYLVLVAHGCCGLTFTSESLGGRPLCASVGGGLLACGRSVSVLRPTPKDRELVQPGCRSRLGGSVRMTAVTDQRHIRYGASDRAGRSWIECTGEAIRHSEFGGVKDLTRGEQVQQAAVRSRRANG